MEVLKACLWFDCDAKEAAEFYCSIFPHSKIGSIVRYGEAGARVSGFEPGSVMTVQFEIEGFPFVAFNGGPVFKINPSISFLVTLPDCNDVVSLYEKLKVGGCELVPLNSYPWSEKYVWVEDKYGVSWQLTTGECKHVVRPALMFTGKQFGRVEEAIKLYSSVFDDSEIEELTLYKSDCRTRKAGDIKRASFTLNGQGFVAFDNPEHYDSSFDYGVSLMSVCRNQNEIDKLWKELSSGGETQQSGWLADRFGVEWQIVPTVLNELMKEPVSANKALEAVLFMKKIVISELLSTVMK